MRLTLRTLLAYMDDRLPSKNAKELGQKIANSPFSTELVERIREVKRRRRLAMPAKPVSMIDANLVAEYLDDQLTPELVARIEKEVLANDIMLAEVAAAHEIIGMLSDPVTIEPQLRDRLYALDPTGRTDVVHALANGSVEKTTAAAVSEEWKPQPVPGESMRRVPIIIAAGLALIWLMTVISDSVLFGPKTETTVAAVEVPDSIQNPPDKNIADDKNPELVQNDAAFEPKDQNAGNSNAGAEVENVVVAVVDPGLAAKAELPKSDPAASDPAASVPEALSAAAPSAPGADVAPAIDPKVPDSKVNKEDITTPSVPRTQIHLMTNNKTFLVFEESVDRWMRLDQIPGGEVVSTTRSTTDSRLLIRNHWFAVAEPFSANLIAQERGWNASLVGTILGRLVSDHAKGLEIYSGRIKISADTMQPWSDDTLPAFALKTGAVTSTLVLKSRDTVVGIEVLPRANASDSNRQSEPASDSAATLLHLNGSDFEVKVTIVAGQVTVKFPGIEQDVALTQGKGLSWMAPGSADPAAVAAKPENIAPDDGSLSSAVPMWVHTTTGSVPEAESLDTQIRSALAGSDDPALAMIPLLSDRNPQVGVRAVRVLTATHDVDRLLSALFENLDESVHRAAIDGLSYIANGSNEGHRTIRSSLETRIPMSEVEITLSLIEGLGDPEARDAAFCQQLIDLLNNDRLATRTLAFYRIQKYSNERLGYQPEAESTRRRDAMRRWQKFLERNGGKLLQ